MAERSKAPDSSRDRLALVEGFEAFWSSIEGVGSNPTPDTFRFLFLSFVNLTDPTGDTKRVIDWPTS
jgi:hypothetical protein